MNQPYCSSCAFFNYDEYWDGEEEVQVFFCTKGHSDHIGFNTNACEDYRTYEGVQDIVDS